MSAFAVFSLHLMCVSLLCCIFFRLHHLTASCSCIFQEGSHPTKVVCVHERCISHAYNVLGYDDGVPLLVCKEDGRVVTLNKGITLKERTKVDFLKIGTNHTYNQRTGLQFWDSSNQTMTLCSLSLAVPTFQGERTTQFKLPRKATGWAFENNSMIYGLVDPCTLVKYSVQTGQVLGVVGLDTKHQLRASLHSPLFALQQGFLIVTGYNGPKQFQKVVADELKWSFTIEGPDSVCSRVLENRGILYFVGCRILRQVYEYRLFGINSATGEIFIRYAPSKLLY